jgi:hypothetical protein
MRQNYIDMAEAIFKIKDLLPLEEYENFVIKVAKIFALDNKRFDELRFFENAGLYIKG